MATSQYKNGGLVKSDNANALNTSNVAEAGKLNGKAANAYLYTRQTEQAANFTAKLGNYYPVNTLGGVVEITMPSPPTADDPQGFTVKDRRSNFPSNNAVLKYDGTNKIMGKEEDLHFDRKTIESEVKWSGDVNWGWEI